MSTRAEIAREYYIRVDAGREDVLDLFTDDVELYFPKFGVAHGKRAFSELASGLFSSLKSITHDHQTMRFVEAGDTVVAEGRTSGETVDGRKWSGGETPGGRFVSVFDFRGDSISRMHVHLDPDYGSHDKGRFLWDARPDQKW